MCYRPHDGSACPLLFASFAVVMQGTEAERKR